LHFSPVGILNTSYFIGFFPVTGIVNKNGEPGLTPNIFVPLIRGSGPGFGVRIISGSCEKAINVSAKARIIRNMNLFFIIS
jgi:hypothetical protein